MILFGLFDLWIIYTFRLSGTTVHLHQSRFAGKLFQGEISASCGFDFSHLAVSGILIVIIDTVILCARCHDKYFKLYFI